MSRVRLSFDRGTLRVDGAVDSIPELVRPDDRTGSHRAPAHHYAAVIDACRRRGLHVDDAVEPAMRTIRASSASPPLRPYQEQALAAFQTFGRRGVIALPTGSGKTRVACGAIAQAGESTLVLVPTRTLLEQWSAVLRSQFGDPIGIVGDGMKQLEAITVMTFESAYRCLDRFGGRFGMLVVDEVHHFASGARAEALEMCPALVRLGLSATPPLPGSLGAERLRDLVGPVVFELEIADLAGRDLAALEIVRIHVALTADERQRYGHDVERFIPVITADVGRIERASILAAFREWCVPAICSARVLNEGVDVPEANIAIIVAGALGAREHVQRIGRILRPQADKRAIAYELVTMDTVDEARTRARWRRFATGRSSPH